MVEVVHGVDTIRGLVGKPPSVTAVDKRDLAEVQKAIMAVNHNFIALIPYCFVCKEPLDWIRDDENDGRLFQCPGCGRTWVKGEGW